MIKVSLSEAEGQVLGHDITEVALDKRCKKVAFARGHVIRKEDLPVLERLGKNNIFVWEGDEQEVHEDDAARLLAPLIAGRNIRYDPAPKEGKISFYSTCQGLFEVDVERLERINRLGIPSLPTIHTHFPVWADKQVAAFRIIPLCCPRETIESIRLLLDRPLLSVLPYAVETAGILVTGNEVYSGRILDGFVPRLSRKLSRLGIRLVRTQTLPDDRDQIRKAIETCRSSCQMILVTGGTSVDPDDVTVAAMRDAGVVFPRQGNPIQPGNNLTIGHAGSTVVCAIPAAALHFETTAFDIFLPRLAAGQRILPEDIAKAGHGGLCHFCGTCNYPNCPFGRSV